MAKKSFKNNPVLQFISVEQPEHMYSEDNHECIDTIDTKDTIDSKGSEYTTYEQYSPNHTDMMEHMYTPKHTDTPVHTVPLSSPECTDTLSYTYTPDIQHREIKSKRLTLLLKPSLFENMSKIATIKRTSVNEAINKAVEEYIQRRTDVIEKYNLVFDDE